MADAGPGPGPLLRVTWQGTPPSKSNQYRIVRRGPEGRKLIKSDACHAFEEDLARLFDAEARLQGYDIRWTIPKGRKNPRPVDPPYPKGTHLCVRVIHQRPTSRGPDVDDLLKSIGDAGNIAGIWDDDRQVREWRASWQIGPQSLLEVVVCPYCDDPTLPSPHSRKEWREIQRAERDLPHEVSTITVFCQLCGCGIGPACAQDEIWLLPQKRRSGWKVEPICGSCASRLNLDHRYRVLDGQDLRHLGRFQAARLIQKKRGELLVDIKRSIRNANS